MKRATLAAVLVLASTRALADPPAEARSHWSFAAMPLLNFSSDTGLGLGVRGKAQRIVDGTSPYQLSLEAQAYGSTGGTQAHFLSIDAPALAGSHWRIDALAGYTRNVAAHYYGLGDHPPVAEDSDDTYEESAPTLRVRARWMFLEHASLQLGYRGMYQIINAPEGSRLMREAPFGAAGGMFSELSAGLAWDTRDDELVPSKGVLLEGAVRATHHLLGSTGDAVGAFGSAAAYQPITHGWLIAARIAADGWWGDVPFNRMGDFGTLISPFMNVAGVGGGMTVRGLLQSEYIGNLKLVSNVELRFPIFAFTLFSQRLALSGVAFADVGQVVNAGAPKLGVGGGLRIRWGKFFIVRLDAGYAEDRVRVYADFGHVF